MGFAPSTSGQVSEGYVIQPLITLDNMLSLFVGALTIGPFGTVMSGSGYRDMVS
jgi:hypothetical protein